MDIEVSRGPGAKIIAIAAKQTSRAVLEREQLKQEIKTTRG
jgi:hypothetical protein